MSSSRRMREVVDPGTPMSIRQHSSEDNSVDTGWIASATSPWSTRKWTDWMAFSNSHDPPPGPGPDDAGISFDLAAGHGAVREARRRIMAVARQLPFTPNDLAAIDLAVGEAAQNAVRHGSSEGDGTVFHVLCRPHAGCLLIEITDHGIGFSPAAVPPPIAEDLKVSGYGICLMFGLVDEVEFIQPPDGGTTVKLVKRYPQPDP